MKRFKIMLSCLLTSLLISLCMNQGILAIGGEHTCHDLTFDTPINNANLSNYYDGDSAYYLESGNYYLSEDIKLLHSVVINENQTVNICLNGKIIDANQYQICVKGTLNLYDCDQSSVHYYDVTNINQVRFTYNSSAAFGIELDKLDWDKINSNNVTVKVTGGAIVNGAPALTVYGGNLLIDGANLIGNNSRGLWVENQFDSDNNYALLREAIVELKAGKILGNSLISSGGAVYVQSGTVNMRKDFEISFNGGENGGAVKVNNEFNYNGTFNMYGGLFRYNSGLNGGVSDTSTGTFNMYDGLMTHNKSSQGSAISNARGGSCFNMYGGTITENTGGCAVYNTNGVIRLGGKSVIENNYDSEGNENNLQTEVPVTIIENGQVDGLTEGASIGIYANEYIVDIPFNFTNDNDGNYLEYFTSDNPDLFVKAIVSENDTTKTNLQLLAIEIAQQPSKENDYTVNAKAAEDNEIAYQWFKKECVELKDQTDAALNIGTQNQNSVAAVYDWGTYYIDFSMYDDFCLEFDCADSFDISCGNLIEQNGNHYCIESKYHCLVLYGYDAYAIENVKFVNNIMLDGQTNAKCGAIDSDGIYYCVATSKGYSATSNMIEPLAIDFSANEGTGTTMETIYQLVGRTIKLPECSYTKTGATFLGWYDGNNVIAAKDEYTVTETIALLAEWSDMKHIILDKDSQTYTYDGQPKVYIPKTIGETICDFEINYFVNNQWVEDAPVNSGTYDVRIMHNEENGYYALCVELEKALKIEPVLKDINDVALQSGGKGEYYVGNGEALNAHIDGIELKDVLGTDENGDSTDYSNIIVYRDLNDDGICQENEKLSYSHDYTVQSGSIRIILSKDYINSLEVGSYKVDVDVTTKSNNTYNFEIPINILETKTVPGTGEGNLIQIVSAVSLISMLAIVIVVACMKKKKR